MIPYVELGGGTVHVQVDDALGLRCEVRQAGQWGLNEGRVSVGKALSQHAGEGDAASAEACLSKELTSGLGAVKFDEGIHAVFYTRAGAVSLRKA